MWNGRTPSRPAANILLVEASDTSFNESASRGVSYAANQTGVVAVSMSWGGSEFAGESASTTTS